MSNLETFPPPLSYPGSDATGTLVMDSTASGSLSSSPQMAAAMTGTSILVDILATLSRLEARLQDQDARLGGIAQSLSTSVAMPTSFRDSDSDEQRRESGPHKHVVMPGQAYQASVTKLHRRLFDFDSRSDLALGKNEDNDDAYTAASAYPSRPLSRPDTLDSCSEPTAAPPGRPGSAPADPALNHHGTGSSCRPSSGSSGSSSVSPAAAVLPAATFASQRRRSSCSSNSNSRWTSWCGKAPIVAGSIKRRLATRSSRSSRLSQASATSPSSARHNGAAKVGGGQRRSHERAEMALHAYDNFFQSFRSPRCHDSEADGTTVKSLVLALRRLVRLVMTAGTVGGTLEGTAGLVA